MTTSAKARQPLSTPRRLWLFLLGIWVATTLLLSSGETALLRARAALQTIGRNAAPGIIAAQEVSATLANLDANEANYLLLDDPIAADAATQLFEFRNAAATKRLVDAAKTGAYGDAEKIPIVMMFENLGRYLELAARARYLHDKHEDAAALDTYRIATDVMHARILLDAEALDQANAKLMDGVYDEELRTSEGSEGLAIGSGVLLLGALVWAQVFLFARTRRVFSVALLAATGVALAFTLDLHGRLRDSRDDLAMAKEGAFASIHALWQARAAAYDASGDQSRYLLDQPNAAAWRAHFNTTVSKLTSGPEFSATAESDAREGRQVSFTGLFAQELNKPSELTFNGERDAAVAMTRAFAAFYTIDARIRAATRDAPQGTERTPGTPRAKRAIDLALGESAVAYDRFEEAVLRTLRINEDVFEQLIDDADARLKVASYLAPTFAIAIVLLAWIGARVRLREYAV